MRVTLAFPYHDGLPAELADGESDVSPRHAEDGVDEVAGLRQACTLWSATKSPPESRLTVVIHDDGEE